MINWISKIEFCIREANEVHKIIAIGMEQQPFFSEERRTGEVYTNKLNHVTDQLRDLLVKVNFQKQRGENVALCSDIPGKRPIARQQDLLRPEMESIETKFVALKYLCTAFSVALLSAQQEAHSKLNGMQNI